MTKQQIKYIFLTIGFYALVLLGIFKAAGNWHLPWFWAVFGVQTLMGISAICLLDQELIAERMKPGGKDKDPYARLILTVLFIAHYALAALDVGRWHFSDNVPLVVQAVAFMLMCAGWAGFVWSMMINKFFSSAIRLQPDRGQKVITEGPYHWMRHPGYAFASLAFIADGLALGSWVSLIPVVIVIGQLVYRTMLEEKMLRADLPGYEEYTKEVRFRWVPGVW